MVKKKAKKTVLIVEDDSMLRKVLTRRIAEEGYRVLEAEDGQEGLQIALKKHPDLLLLDLMMPVMDGVEMLKELRKDKWGSGVYVYILTNKEPDTDILDEAEREPYRSTYLMKSDYGIDEMVEVVNGYFEK
ncbi:response regulator [Candidatus Peregrinibacteria bacterium]|nr:response regulator [Candidatus Peregrinibacteria bacterium]